MLAKAISRGKHSNLLKCWQKQFQGGSVLIAEMLVESKFKGEAF